MAGIVIYSSSFASSIFLLPRARPLQPRGADGAVEPAAQALAAEPEVLLFLMATFTEMVKRADWRAGVLAGAFVISFACLRFRHLQRSHPFSQCPHGNEGLFEVSVVTAPPLFGML